MCNYTCGGYAPQPAWSVPCNYQVVCDSAVEEVGYGRPGICVILVLFILLAIICRCLNEDEFEDDDCCCECECDCF